MQAGKKYSLWQTLMWQRKYLLTFFLFDALVVALYAVFDLTCLAIPWQPLSIIGIAVAFYLGFKNNSSYERLWEARKIWGGIVNTSRSITVMIRDFVNNSHAETPATDDVLKMERRRMVMRHTAWLHALTFQLRRVMAWEHDSSMDWEHRKGLGLQDINGKFDLLRAYLSKEEYDYSMAKGNTASHILSLQSKHFATLQSQGLIDDFRHMELQSMITELYALQGKSERIKNFPFPRQYASANLFFVSLFIFILPFSLMSIFDQLEMSASVWLTVPFSLLASWVFWTMEMIGDYSENPFEGLHNDVPISSIARSIEIDIRQMIEDQDIPAPLEPVGPMRILY